MQPIFIDSSEVIKGQLTIEKSAFHLSNKQESNTSRKGTKQGLFNHYKKKEHQNEDIKILTDKTPTLNHSKTTGSINISVKIPDTLTDENKGKFTIIQPIFRHSKGTKEKSYKSFQKEKRITVQSKFYITNI